MATELFKDSVNYALVKIHNGKYFSKQPDTSGMTPSGEIYASDKAYQNDYGLQNPQTKAFFLHEMTHVWQYQQNILHVKTSAVLEYVWHLTYYDEAYKYTLEDGKGLIDYEIEQQASIVEDYYLVVKRGLDFGSRILNGGTKAEKKNLLQRVMGDFISDPSLPVR